MITPGKLYKLLSPRRAYSVGGGPVSLARGEVLLCVRKATALENVSLGNQYYAFLWEETLVLLPEVGFVDEYRSYAVILEPVEEEVP